MTLQPTRYSGTLGAIIFQKKSSLFVIHTLKYLSHPCLLVHSESLPIAQAAIVDPVDPDSVIAAVEEEGVSKVLRYFSLQFNMLLKDLLLVLVASCLTSSVYLEVTLTTLLTTHHHWDHAGGNADLIKKVEISS